jgi:PAS domain S-box-containing protein
MIITNKMATPPGESPQSYLLKLADAIRPLSDAVAIVDVVTQTALDYFKADRCYYCEIKGDVATIRRDAHRADLLSVANVYSMSEMPLFKSLLQSNQPIVVADVETSNVMDNVLKQLCLSVNIQAYMAVPVFKDNEPVGNFCLTQSKPRQWQDFEVELAKDIAERTWAEVERAHAEEALRESEYRFRAMADTAPVLIWELDESGVIFVNGHYLDFFGVGFEMVRGTGWTAFLHPDDVEAYTDAYRTAFNQRQPYTFECRFRRADGQYRWLRNIGRPVGANRFVGCSIDTTEHKRTEANLAFLAETSADFAPLASAEAIMSRVGERLGGFLGLSRCNFSIIDDAADCLETIYEWRHNETMPSFLGKHRISDYLNEDGLRRYQSGEISVVNDVRTDPRMKTPEYNFEQFQIGSVIDAPYLQNGRWIFLLSACRAESSEWRTDEIELMRELAARIHIRLERARAEEALRESEERLRIAVEAAELATWKWDLVKQEVFWNKQHFLLFGMEPHSNPVSPEEFFRHIHPDDRASVTASLEKSLRQKVPYDEDFRAVLDTGETRWMSSYGRVIAEDANGNPTQMSGVMFDITERKQSEQTLKEADRRKDEFLATLAHELRNPLAPIRIGLDIMKRRESQEVGTEARHVIERQVMQIIHLVNDLLDISRISQGKITLQIERVALSDFINMALETNQSSLLEARHEMIVSLPSTPVYVNGDFARLTQIVLNLLNNAVKYTEPGGTIQLSATIEEQHVIIRVKDSGIGIPAEMLPHIFDAFTQIEHSSKQMQGGLGIGLSLVKTLVEMHGGTIDAASDEVGSEFVVRLPLAESQQPETSHAPEAESVSAPQQHVLVVDDNEDAVQMMSIILTMQGHEVVTAVDGASAIQMALAERPTVAILDIGLPDMSGYDVAREIRQHLPNILLIALSGWGRKEDRAKSREAGFDFHLVKPVDPEHLQALFQANQ